MNEKDLLSNNQLLETLEIFSIVTNNNRLYNKQVLVHF